MGFGIGYGAAIAGAQDAPQQIINGYTQGKVTADYLNQMEGAKTAREIAQKPISMEDYNTQNPDASPMERMQEEHTRRAALANKMGRADIANVYQQKASDLGFQGFQKQVNQAYSGLLGPNPQAALPMLNKLPHFSQDPVTDVQRNVDETTGEPSFTFKTQSGHVNTLSAGELDAVRANLSGDKNAWHYNTNIAAGVRAKGHDQARVDVADVAAEAKKEVSDSQARTKTYGYNSEYDKAIEVAKIRGAAALQKLTTINPSLKLPSQQFFAQSFAKSLYGKQYSDLTPEEEAEVRTAVADHMERMAQGNARGKTAGSMEGMGVNKPAPGPVDQSQQQPAPPQQPNPYGGQAQPGQPVPPKQSLPPTKINPANNKLYYLWSDGHYHSTPAKR